MRKRIQPASNTIENTFYITGWCLLSIAVIYYLFCSVTHFQLSKYTVPCLMHTITGLYCPGCGGTRAVSFLLHGDFLLSFLYHPLVPYAAVLCGWFMISQTIERLSRHQIRIGMHYRDIYLWIALTIVILNFIVKNALLLGWHIDLLQIRF